MRVTMDRGVQMNPQLEALLYSGPSTTRCGFEQREKRDSDERKA